jgi:predicted acyltransferase
LDPYCNFAGYVDRAVFSPAHILEQTDPEGLISTITASFTTFIGYNYGLMVLKFKKTPEKLIRYWLIIAVICGICIYPCSLLMPFNKRLYTITFLFTNLCSCSIVLSLFMYFVDILPRKYPQIKRKVLRVFQPMNWLGLNPLAIFILLQILYSDLMKGYWIRWGDNNTLYTAFYDAAFSWMGPYIGTLAYTLLYAVFLTLIGGILYHYKIFLRL